nr:hypothetical protein [Tanacetum cinerariifolium]
MMIYLRNVAGFKMDYFKGMTYDDIHLIFETKFNSNMAFLQKKKEQMEEEDGRALKRISESQEDKAAKKKKLDEKVKDKQEKDKIRSKPDKNEKHGEAGRSQKQLQKGKEDNAVKRSQALKRKPQTEAQARKNMMIYLRNVAGFKMDYFKGMTYDDIHLIFETKFNSNMAFLQKKKEQMEEEDGRALKRISESQEDKAAKKQKLDEKVLVVDYEIYTKNNKPYYKIIRADESPQLFLSFLCLLGILTEKTWRYFGNWLKKVQTPGSGISILLAVGTPSTGSGNLYCQRELSPGSGNALCILFPTKLSGPKCDGERDVNVNETFHEQTDDELFERELKQIEADDQAIQTILLGLPEEIYAAVDSCETA